MIKSFIIDTNILLRSGRSAIHGFQENNIYITQTTMQELDNMKNDPGETGYNAREVIRELDRLREKGDFTEGVPIGEGKLFLGCDRILKEYLPEGFSLDKPDNQIISSCISLHKKLSPDSICILVTNDISLRVNAETVFRYFRLDIPVQGYYNDMVESNNYKGYQEIEIPDYHFIEETFKKNHDRVYDRKIPEGYGEFEENEFLRIYSGNISALGIHKSGYFRMIRDSEVTAFGIHPKNMLQTFALYALLAPPDEIPLVIMGGPAGTGKTFLALAAGLDKTYNDKKERLYNRILITRNNSIPANEDHGYLKGSLEEKMEPLLLPYKDSLLSLLKKDSDESLEEITMQMEDLFVSGIIDIFSMAYIRGRSIPDSYIIVDEAQNLNKTQMRDLLTRVSTGSKLVLCGDLEQIDASYLDKRTSGFSYAAKYMKGSLCAQIMFGEKESQRSPLASAALQRLGRPGVKQE